MEPMLTIALRAGRKAAELIERAFERVDLLTIETKSRNDYVTEVDKAAEKEIIYHLRKAYPDHSIRGEEGGHQPGKNPDYEWIIDPLDGTTNFIHGVPHFSVSIACKYKGQIEHAVVIEVDRGGPVQRGANRHGRRAAAVVLESHAEQLENEAVRKPEQLDGLRALGCDIAQGFLFAKALSSGDLEELVRTRPRW